MDMRIFWGAIRSVKVSYPVPFIFAASLAFTLLCIAASAFAKGPIAWLIIGIGAFVAVNATLLVSYAALFKPDLLRSEHYQVANRYFDIFLEDSDMTELTHDRLGKVVSGFTDEPISKSQAADRDQKRLESGSKDEDV
jgi:hypothetical protein